MLRRLTCALATAALSLALLPATSTADLPSARFKPGAPGAGDPYFPLDGNGGYDVKHYDIRVAYHPATDRLRGVVRIKARATQNLSAFNLDFDGMTVTRVRVNNARSTWSRQRGELTIKPSQGIRRGRIFRTQVRYDGVPKRLSVGGLGDGGFFHGDNRALALGQPHSASTWFPVNDHPTDKATYAFHVTIPRGLKALSNGHLRGRSVHGSRVTWNWRMSTPMASYLATIAIGNFDLRAYRRDGLRFLDAVDKKLVGPFSARSGERFAIARRGQPAYKRLSRHIDVPATGATVSFWVNRDTEEQFDFLFVESHTVGRNNWTTLPDANGHTTRSTGFACPYGLKLHPFLRHYQTPEQGACRPTGTTGDWWAATGMSRGWEKWSIDLSSFAGETIQFSISYVSDDIIQYPGVLLDDIVVSTGQGTTSFERDGNVRDGWTTTGSPTGSEQNPTDWIVGSSSQAPPTRGKIAQMSLARQPEILRFLSKRFGPYPFTTAGGIVPLERRIGFALETQTRPVYSYLFFSHLDPGTDVVVHELAHQWYGNALTVRRWRHIWLNEGFATYAEWLWSERTGDGTAQQIFDFYKGIPAGDPFWDVRIGNPGRGQMFDFAVYARGAMTLHKLRVKMGDEDFFRLLRTWTRTEKGDHVTTAGFIRLAERISDKHLRAFFHRWLMTTRKPTAAPGEAASSSPIATLLQRNARVLRSDAERVSLRR